MCLHSHRGSRCLSARFIPSICAVVVSSCLSLSCFSPSSTSSLPYSTCSLPDTPSSMSSPAEGYNHCTHAEWGVLHHGDIPSSHRLWAQRPRQLRLLRDFCSDLPGWIRRQRYGALVLVRCGTRRWDYRKSAIFTLFIQEREEPANLRQAHHSHEESLLPAQSFFAHTSTGRPIYEPSSSQKRKSSRDMENERIRILFERQKEQILAEVRTEIQKHELQADSDRKKYPGIDWNHWVSAKKRLIIL